jgi:hypothetical protein
MKKKRKIGKAAKGAVHGDLDLLVLLKSKRFGLESIDLAKEHNLIIAIHRAWQRR